MNTLEKQLFAVAILAVIREKHGRGYHPSVNGIEEVFESLLKDQLPNVTISFDDKWLIITEANRRLARDAEEYAQR